MCPISNYFCPHPYHTFLLINFKDSTAPTPLSPSTSSARLLLKGSRVRERCRFRSARLLPREVERDGERTTTPDSPFPVDELGSSPP